MCDKIEHIADFVYIKKDRIWDIMDNELKDNQGKEELFHERSEITKVYRSVTTSVNSERSHCFIITESCFWSLSFLT